MITEKDKEDIFNYASSINLELEKKVYSPTTVTEEVLLWTSFQKELTKKIFEIILDQDEPFIPQGQEKERVDKLVRSRLIENWEFKEASEHLRQIQNLIVNSKQSAKLLRRYQRILQRGEVQSDNSPEERELLSSGLVSVIGGRLKVSNRIYEAVFNWSWVTQELNKSNRPDLAFFRRRRQLRLVLWVVLSVLALLTAIAFPQVINFSKLIGFINPTFNPQVQTADNTRRNPKTFKEVQVPKGIFNYGGSTSLAPISSSSTIVEQAIKKAHSEFQLRYMLPITGSPGSNNGIKMLLEDQLAFSLSSRGLKPEEKSFTLNAIPVAIDAIAVAVNHNLNLNNKGITIDQLKGIYTGDITNWKQVGGPDRPITAYSRREKDSGTVEFFREKILGENGKFGTNVQFIPITTDALREVAKTPGGIYYGSAPEVVPQCTIKSLPIGRQATKLVPPYKEPFVPPSQCSEQHHNQLNKEAFRSGQYPITRHLFVVVKQNGQDEERAGKAYANLLKTDQGQKLIEEAGFVRIR